MAIHLTPKNSNVQRLIVADKTFSLLVEGPLKKIIQAPVDDIQLDDRTAISCAIALEKWIPPTGWFGHGKEYSGLCTFLDLFRRSNGLHIQIEG
jgi:hypothetical protein